jgi:rhamnosyltransferase
VIDSGSTDDTLKIAESHPVLLMNISPSEWGYSAAINRAARVATGEILVILSAHCPPVHDQWLANLLRHFDDPRVAAAWGPSLTPWRPRPEPGPPLRQEPGTYRFENRWWGLSNPNAAVRRSLWMEMPFDESLPATEDKAWGREAMNRGLSIVHDPAAAVWHPAHTPLSAYRRTKAVTAGFSIMFPESRSRGPRVWTLARAAVRATLFHLKNRRMKALWKDLQRIPSIAAAVIGGVAGARARRKSP